MGQFADAIAAIRGWTAAAVQAMADYWAAAVLYEQLSGLSDAELRRRGLARDTLARDARAACDGSAVRR